ncbi:hypothetical protein [Nocardioides sp. Root140]|uniref:hypothetical protein n=1 Tax=Nocardioides sp. Root140 TaxID=1736460 RepID=UPI0006F7CCD1|nr:hypothetical protein [Nocardioides sp. Root140]KQY62429.1 hypothetical protein ASD30_23970 [Nocardioides sp. Root140]
MANLNLDAGVPGQVASASSLRADLGEGRSLLVVSGVARPEFGIDDDQVHREVCRVRLRVPATRIEQLTVHVSPAAFSNDESAYVFATDEASLEIDESGELVLVAHLALMGESSTLNRFSYQVVCIDHALATEVTGTLSWPTAWFRPASTDPASLAGAFDIEAKAVRVTGGTMDELTFLAFGTITGVTVGDTTTTATYRVAGVPVDTLIEIVVVARALEPPGGAGARMLPDPFNVARFTLSAAQPTRGNVNFKGVKVGGPA